MRANDKSRKRAKAPKKQTMMRLPIDLHKRLRDSAEGSGRSLNSETVMRLRESLAKEARV